jgi:hypothetical protein
MPDSLRDAWTRVVAAADYEQFMASIGQAQANAAHLADFLETMAEFPDGGVVIAGAGTGQFLDYIPAAAVDLRRLVFSDISPAFLKLLRARAPGAVCVADDLEHSSLSGEFAAAAAVLVLEHIDWRRGVASLISLDPRFLFFVIQKNPAHMTEAVTPGRTPPGSMRIFKEVHPRLMVQAELTDFLLAAGYTLVEQTPREVADGKVMMGLLYEFKLSAA